MKKIIIFLVFCLISSNSLAQSKFEKDLKVLSQLSSFINNKGEPYNIEEIKNKNNYIILIYNHGSSGSEIKRDNCNRIWWKMPPAIYQLDGSKVKNYTIKTYHLCSGARGWSEKEENYFWDMYDRFNQDPNKVLDIKDEYGKALFDKSSYSTKRKIIKLKIDEFKNQGFKNIILAGHSAGAWASLVLKSNFPDKINGVIAFNPARSGKFAAKKNPDSDWVNWRNYKVSEIKLDKLEKILVFTHDKDKYENKKTLSFLINYKNVEHIDLTNSKCKGKIKFGGYHGIIKTKCFAQSDPSYFEIIKYIKNIY